MMGGEDGRGQVDDTLKREMEPKRKKVKEGARMKEQRVEEVKGVLYSHFNISSTLHPCLC